MQDSNTTITSYRNEEVIITGSIIIKKEKFDLVRENEDIKVYKATFDGECSQNTFVGSKRLVRARFVLKILLVNVLKSS